MDVEVLCHLHLLLTADPSHISRKVNDLQAMCLQIRQIYCILG